MIQAALGSQSTRLGTHGCRREAFRADDSSARPCGGTEGLQLCCAQSTAAAGAAVAAAGRRRGSSRREGERRSEMKADWKLDMRAAETLRQKVTQGLEWSRRASGAGAAGTWAATSLPRNLTGTISRETPRVFNPRDARPANVPHAGGVKSEQSSKQKHKITTHPVGRKGTNTE